MRHLDDNTMLSQYQHGFCSEHSCESLSSFTQEVYDNLESGNQTDIIVMDFSKAFDKVDHNKLPVIWRENSLDTSVRDI